MDRINQRQETIVKEFSLLPNWEARYKHLIDIGKSSPSLPESKRAPDALVKGCQSQVWLHATFDADRGEILFSADSDALIVKGLVTLLLRVYSQASPEEILQSSPKFIELIGLKENLSPSRANGLMAMIRQMKYYAAAFQALQKNST